MRISPVAFLLLIVVAIALFGGKRLPDLARSLGKSMRILKSEAKAMRREGSDAPPPQPPAQDARPAVEAPRTIKAAPGDSGASRPSTGQGPGRQG
ncbi:Sec-independent protein translocase subunit TatA [Kitasatospora sp. GP82]|uniref:Sec-independent protein translocase subunit TatA n=1 Tax=Kitasatospora sp. GP82 TaxID=3035089 RepID=UPI0024769ADA|nr:Sec-independent protein translocase subunit TatA [Kitasatospora sp. GP82]MDH6127072.1 sec-independent protein translocase protein TatA [Kitasatospora sp. GP82]